MMMMVLRDKTNRNKTEIPRELFHSETLSPRLLPHSSLRSCSLSPADIRLFGTQVTLWAKCRTGDFILLLDRYL